MLYYVNVMYSICVYRVLYIEYCIHVYVNRDIIVLYCYLAML